MIDRETINQWSKDAHEELKSDGYEYDFTDVMWAVAQKAAEAEREKCANLAESELCSCCWSDDQIIAGEQVASAIRARGTASL